MLTHTLQALFMEVMGVYERYDDTLTLFLWEKSITTSTTN